MRDGKLYRKTLTAFCAIHMLTDAIIILISVIGLTSIEFMSNMLYITMIETAVLSVAGLILGLIELFKMKEYLEYTEYKDPQSKLSKKRLAVSSGVDFMDKDSREQLIRNLLGNIKNNQGMFLNNKLDELLVQFGDRRCASCIEFYTGWEKTDDPRKVLTWPLTPEHLKEYDADFKFTKEDMFGMQEDNVYFDVAVKP
jgi:hypothetical protein